MGSKSFYDVMTRPRTDGPIYWQHLQPRHLHPPSQHYIYLPWQGQTQLNLSPLPNRIFVPKPRRDSVGFSMFILCSYYISNLSSTISHVLRPTLYLSSLGGSANLPPVPDSSRAREEQMVAEESTAGRYLSRAYEMLVPFLRAPPARGRRGQSRIYPFPQSRLLYPNRTGLPAAGCHVVTFKLRED